MWILAPIGSDLASNDAGTKDPEIAKILRDALQTEEGRYALGVAFVEPAREAMEFRKRERIANGGDPGN